MKRFSPLHLVTLSRCHLVIAFALLILPALARAQTAQKLPAPTTDVPAANCTQSGCHTEVKNYKVLHGPVNVNACNACHTLVDAAKHKYVDAHPKNESCTFCHKMDLTAAAFVHKPLTTGDCSVCHNPHGGKTNRFMRTDTLRETCVKCHKDNITGKSHIHGPVAAGACEACHKPHTADNAKLLVATGRALCLNCHKEMNDQLKLAKVTHKPVMEADCTVCHDAHASNFRMQIKDDPGKLCVSCHEHDKIRQAVMEAKYKHSIVLKDQACLNCHTPHGGQLAKLMKAQPVDICLKCHNQDQKTSDGRNVPSVAEIANSQLSRHGPARDGTCSGCHNAHGSDTSRLLTKCYPETFYTKFEPDNFALCFSCHDQKLIETKEVEGLTGFRNGTRNLHFLHVDREKGRTCRACHETHAAKNPLLIRDSVPFGQWELPINYVKTPTGGSCSPGCHKQYAYDRNTPIDNNPAQPNIANTNPQSPATSAAANSTPTSPTPAPQPPPPPSAQPQPEQRTLDLPH
ncbi:MAG TPA: cytochrome c3 family protein [Phycisphaerae bacterium]|nr:cytochrome c3 family protein [Phycisphaerae bacterium]